MSTGGWLYSDLIPQGTGTRDIVRVLYYIISKGTYICKFEHQVLNQWKSQQIEVETKK